jgi:hypothetical protein
MRINIIESLPYNSEAMTPVVNDLLQELNEQQLDEFTAKIFEWQNSSDMLAWLEDC